MYSVESYAELTLMEWMTDDSYSISYDMGPQRSKNYIIYDI